MISEAPPKKLAIQCVFDVRSKAQPGKVWYLLCRRRLSQSKYGMHCVFEGSAKQSMVFIVSSKAQPSKAQLICGFEGSEEQSSASKAQSICGFEGSAEQSTVDLWF